MHNRTNARSQARVAVSSVLRRYASTEIHPKATIPARANAMPALLSGSLMPTATSAAAAAPLTAEYVTHPHRRRPAKRRTNTKQAAVDEVKAVKKAAPCSIACQLRWVDAVTGPRV